MLPAMRYDMRKIDSGWCVWDTVTNAPAVVEGRWQTDMAMEDADDLTDLLNRLDVEAKGATKN
jgi:hypothetical protein